MRVLVTGGAGYIGSCIIEELLNQNYDPVVFDTFYWGRDSLAIYKDQIRFIKGDCRNSRDIIYALEDVDAIIHLAGIVGAFVCASNHKAHFSINVESTRTLINCCTDPELDLVRDFIYASSCSVYGNVQGIHEEVTEETSPAPLSSYAYAKLLSEKIILERAISVPHFHPTILRLTTVFGWSNRPRLDLVTNQFAYKAWKDKIIQIYGDGQQYRSLIHVKDVARAFVDVLNAKRFIRSGQIFHVGEEKNNKTIREVAEIVKSIVPGTNIELLKDKPTDRRDYRINCSKLKNTIGWEAIHSVEDGVKEITEKFKTLDYNWDSEKYKNSSFEYV